MMKTTRRNFTLGALGASLATFVTGASPSPNTRRFLFVHAVGGWDPLAVFAPLYNAPQINMEPDSSLATVGNFQLVDGPQRPSVVPFFQRWGDRTLLLNGLNTRSVNHETCQIVALTGRTSESATGWPTMLAVSDPQSYYLPHLVLAGPAFPGPNTVYVTHAQGLVQQAISGEMLEFMDLPVEPSGDELRTAVDAYLAERATSFGDKHDSIFARDYQTAVTRSQELVAADIVEFPEAEGLRAQGLNAIRAMADGVTRCATVASGYDWDTHVNNAQQSPLFETLFSDLDAVLEAMEQTTTKEGNKLSDETVVVVLSEMGRTPQYNATNGRDHWPYTSAMIIGPGITGGRTIGGYTDLYGGIGVDPASGDLDPNRLGIDATALGATLLQLGGVDPAEHIQNPEVLTGVLS